MNRNTFLNFLFISGTAFIVGACSSLPQHSTMQQTAIQSESQVNANYALNKQYFVCVAESCHQASPLKPITLDELKPLEPDVSPIIVVKNNDIIKSYPIRKTKKNLHKKPKKKILKNQNDILIKKCFFIKPGESVNILDSKQLIDKVQNKLAESQIKKIPTAKIQSLKPQLESKPITGQVSQGNKLNQGGKANVANQVINMFGG